MGDYAVGNTGAGRQTPDGRYVVLTFDTKFANKSAATETVAMVMEGGNWKPAGYHVR